MLQEIPKPESDNSVERRLPGRKRDRSRSPLEYIGAENERIQKQLYAVDEQKLIPVTELLYKLKDNSNDFRFQVVAKILNGEGNVNRLYTALDRIVMHAVENHIKARPEDFNISSVDKKDRVNFTDAKQGFIEARQILQKVTRHEETENISPYYYNWMLTLREVKIVLDKSIQDTRTPSPSPSPSVIESSLPSPQGDRGPSTEPRSSSPSALERTLPSPQRDIPPSPPSKPLDPPASESGKQPRIRRAAAEKATEETRRMYRDYPPLQIPRKKKQPPRPTKPLPDTSTSGHVSPPHQEEAELPTKRQRRAAAEKASKETSKMYEETKGWLTK